MTIKLIKRGTTGEYVIEGRFESTTSPEVERILKETNVDFEKVILNFERLQYISSAGLRVVKSLYMEMNRRGGRLIVSHVNDFVMEVFEMTGFAQILEFE